jgi:hypothetical protein
MNFIIKPFKSTWKRMKSKIDDLDIEFFYEVIDIDGTVGRRIYPGCGREDNPRFYTHWFPHGRCHWNVALPCFILNKRNMIGSFKIITNDKHSAIINTVTNEIFDPTYDGNIENTINQFKDGYEMVELVQHLVTLSAELSEKAFSFAAKHYHKDKVNEFVDIVDSFIKKKSVAKSSNS